MLVCMHKTLAFVLEFIWGCRSGLLTSKKHGNFLRFSTHFLRNLYFYLNSDIMYGFAHDTRILYMIEWVRRNRNWSRFKIFRKFQGFSSILKGFTVITHKKHFLTHNTQMEIFLNLFCENLCNTQIKYKQSTFE